MNVCLQTVGVWYIIFSKDLLNHLPEFKMTIYRCQLLHYYIYTTTVVSDLLLPTCFDQIKYLNNILIEMKLEMQQLIEEKKNAN